MPATRIAFAACAKINFDEVQPVWDEIRSWRPHHLMLLGDQIYMDYHGDQDAGGQPVRIGGRYVDFKAYASGASAAISDVEFAQQMRLRYELQFRVPSFRALVHDVGSRGGAVQMVWDDHDFGFNNAVGLLGGDMDADPDFLAKVISPAKRVISRRLFEEFRLNVQALRVNANTVYERVPAAWQPLDAQGSFLGVQRCLHLGAVDVLMLDIRSFRQNPSREGSLEGGSEILGRGQWAWLEANLRGGDAPVAIIASGSPLSSAGFLADQSWKQGGEILNPLGVGLLPYREYPMLLRLADELAGRRRLLFVGGDRHTTKLLLSNPHLPEVVCAGAASPKLVHGGRHFGLVDVLLDGRCHVQLFTAGVVDCAAWCFGSGEVASTEDVSVRREVVQAIHGAFATRLLASNRHVPGARACEATRQTPRPACVPGEPTDQMGDRVRYYYFGGNERRAHGARLSGWQEVMDDDFWSAVHDTCEKLHDPARMDVQLCLFVPGHRKTSDEVIAQYGVLQDICFDKQGAGSLGVCVGYDWASMGGGGFEFPWQVANAYKENLLLRVEQNVRHFAEVLRKAHGVARCLRMPLSIVAQSLGNRLVVRTLLHIGDDLPEDFVSHYYANAADIPRDFFHPRSDHADAAKAVLRACRAITVPFTERDTTLGFAQHALLADGERLGLRGPVAGSRHDKLFFLDVSRMVYGLDPHGGLFTTPWRQEHDRLPLIQRFYEDMRNPPALRYGDGR